MYVFVVVRHDAVATATQPYRCRVEQAEGSAAVLVVGAQLLVQTGLL